MRELTVPSTTHYPHADCFVNPYVDRQAKVALCGMHSKLQALFVERLKEELADKKLTPNAFAVLAKQHGVGYGSIFRILKGKQDPTLSMVNAIADALGLPTWYLLTRKDQVEERVIRMPANVVTLPDPYRRIMPPKPVRKVTNGKQKRQK